MHTTIAAAADRQFEVLLWGPPFCGAPVRPSMLNMPKSASDVNGSVEQRDDHMSGHMYSYMLC